METRIWCEFTHPQELCKDFVLELLKRHHITLNYKLEFGCEDKAFFDMIQTYNEKQIPISIWATLSDEMGYWINEYNARHFDRYIRRLIGTLEDRNLQIRGLCIDMEPPLADVERLTKPKHWLEPCFTFGKMIGGNLNKKRFNEAKAILEGTANYIRDKGLEGYVTCLRHCYYDLRFNTEVMQNALEIPVFDVNWDKYNVMYYATMIRNEMKRIKKVNVDYLIFHQVSRLKEKLKEKLSISVGVTNIGKMGNEPYYESMEEFSKDIGVIKACGVEDLALFSLDGIMEEKKLEQYLNIIENAVPFKPEVCPQVHRNENLSQALMHMLKKYYKMRR